MGRDPASLSQNGNSSDFDKSSPQGHDGDKCYVLILTSGCMIDAKINLFFLMGAIYCYLRLKKRTWGGKEVKTRGGGGKMMG